MGIIPVCEGSDHGVDDHLNDRLRSKHQSDLDILVQEGSMCVCGGSRRSLLHSLVVVDGDVCCVVLRVLRELVRVVRAQKLDVISVWSARNDGFPTFEVVMFGVIVLVEAGEVVEVKDGDVASYLFESFGSFV